MNVHSNNTTDAVRQEAMFKARERLTRIKDLNELVFMAGEGMLNTCRKSANAITAGADTISDLLDELGDLLDEVMA